MYKHPEMGQKLGTILDLLPLMNEKQQPSPIFNTCKRRKLEQ